MTTASNWLLNWAIAYSTPYLVNPGQGNANLQAKIFFLWGGCCLICAFFVWGMTYETKGLSLEEIDEMYEKVDHAWQSNNFAPSKDFRLEDERNTATGSGEKLTEDAPIVDHSSDQTEVTGAPEHLEGNGVPEHTHGNGVAKEASV